MAGNARTHEVTGWVGWVAFAAGILLLGGVFQFIIGLTAIFNPQWFVVSHQGLLILDLMTWGWVHMLLGLLMGVTGISLFTGSIAARAIAAILAGFSAVANLAFLGAYPLWSLVVITIDLLVIYAITVHGEEMSDL